MNGLSFARFYQRKFRFSVIVTNKGRNFHGFSDGAQFSEIAEENIARFENVLDELHEIEPQDKIDGVRNTWIVKPGAKSRGRGQCSFSRILLEV